MYGEQLKRKCVNLFVCEVQAKCGTYMPNAWSLAGLYYIVQMYKQVCGAPKSLTLSLWKGGGLLQPPLLDFLSYHFCVFAKIAIQSIYLPFV